MKNVIILFAVGVISFLATFAFTTRDEIGEEVVQRLDSDFTRQCVARAQFPEQLEPYAEEICDCMKSEFDDRGLKLTDAFGSKRGEMRQITQSCAQDWM